VRRSSSTSPSYELKLGVLGDFQADTVDDSGAAAIHHLFVRRVRLLFGGQIAKNVTFFVEAGTPNLGKTFPDGKTFSSRDY